MNITLNGYKLYFDSLCTDRRLIHSDTLYGMIVNALCQLGLIGDDPPSIPFRISSAFPFYDKYLFFPMPVDFPLYFDRPDISLYTGTWFISQQLLTAYYETKLSDYTIHRSGWFLAEESHPIHMVYPLWEPSASSAARTNMPIIRFKEKSGLYFLAKQLTPSGADMLESALQFIADEGIGRGRSIGAGRFVLSRLKSEFSAETIDRRILLSLYCPKQEDCENCLKSARVRLIKRTKTPIFGSLRAMKYCYMATEGSVFDANKPVPDGNVIKFFNANKRLFMETPIYRFGTTFFLD